MGFFNKNVSGIILLGCALAHSVGSIPLSDFPVKKRLHQLFEKSELKSAFPKVFTSSINTEESKSNKSSATNGSSAKVSFPGEEKNKIKNKKLENIGNPRLIRPEQRHIDLDSKSRTVLNEARAENQSSVSRLNNVPVVNESSDSLHSTAMSNVNVEVENIQKSYSNQSIAVKTINSDILNTDKKSGTIINANAKNIEEINKSSTVSNVISAEQSNGRDSVASKGELNNQKHNSPDITDNSDNKLHFNTNENVQDSEELKNTNQIINNEAGFEHYGQKDQQVYTADSVHGIGESGVRQIPNDQIGNKNAISNESAVNNVNENTKTSLEDKVHGDGARSNEYDVYTNNENVNKTVDNQNNSIDSLNNDNNGTDQQANNNQQERTTGSAQVIDESGVKQVPNDQIGDKNAISNESTVNNELADNVNENTKTSLEDKDHDDVTRSTEYDIHVNSGKVNKTDNNQNNSIDSLNNGNNGTDQQANNNQQEYTADSSHEINKSTLSESPDNGREDIPSADNEGKKDISSESPNNGREDIPSADNEGKKDISSESPNTGREDIPSADNEGKKDISSESPNTGREDILSIDDKGQTSIDIQGRSSDVTLDRLEDAISFLNSIAAGNKLLVDGVNVATLLLPFLNTLKKANNKTRNDSEKDEKSGGKDHDSRKNLGSKKFGQNITPIPTAMEYIRGTSRSADEEKKLKKKTDTSVVLYVQKRVDDEKCEPVTAVVPLKNKETDIEICKAEDHAMCAPDDKTVSIKSDAKNYDFTLNPDSKAFSQSVTPVPTALEYIRGSKHSAGEGSDSTQKSPNTDYKSLPESLPPPAVAVELLLLYIILQILFSSNDFNEKGTTDSSNAQTGSRENLNNSNIKTNNSNMINNSLNKNINNEVQNNNNTELNVNVNNNQNNFVNSSINNNNNNNNSIDQHANNNRQEHKDNSMQGIDESESKQSQKYQSDDKNNISNENTVNDERVNDVNKKAKTSLKNKVHNGTRSNKDVNVNSVEVNKTSYNHNSLVDIKDGTNDQQTGGNKQSYETGLVHKTNEIKVKQKNSDQNVSIVNVSNKSDVQDRFISNMSEHVKNSPENEKSDNASSTSLVTKNSERSLISSNDDDNSAYGLGLNSLLENILLEYLNNEIDLNPYILKNGQANSSNIIVRIVRKNNNKNTISMNLESRDSAIQKRKSSGQDPDYFIKISDIDSEQISRIFSLMRPGTKNGKMSINKWLFSKIAKLFEGKRITFQILKKSRENSNSFHLDNGSSNSLKLIGNQRFVDQISENLSSVKTLSAESGVKNSANKNNAPIKSPDIDQEMENNNLDKIKYNKNKDILSKREPLIKDRDLNPLANKVKNKESEITKSPKYNKLEKQSTSMENTGKKLPETKETVSVSTSVKTESSNSDKKFGNGTVFLGQGEVPLIKEQNYNFYLVKVPKPKLEVEKVNEVTILPKKIKKTKPVLKIQKIVSVSLESKEIPDVVEQIVDKIALTGKEIDELLLKKMPKSELKVNAVDSISLLDEDPSEKYKQDLKCQGVEKPFLSKKEKEKPNLKKENVSKIELLGKENSLEVKKTNEILLEKISKPELEIGEANNFHIKGKDPSEKYKQDLKCQGVEKPFLSKKEKEKPNLKKENVSKIELLGKENPLKVDKTTGIFLEEISKPELEIREANNFHIKGKGPSKRYEQDVKCQKVEELSLSKKEKKKLEIVGVDTFCLKKVPKPKPKLDIKKVNKISLIEIEKSNIEIEKPNFEKANVDAISLPGKKKKTLITKQIDKPLLAQISEPELTVEQMNNLTNLPEKIKKTKPVLKIQKIDSVSLGNKETRDVLEQKVNEIGEVDSHKLENQENEDEITFVGKKENIKESPVDSEENTDSLEELIDDLSNYSEKIKKMQIPDKDNEDTKDLKNAILETNKNFAAFLRCLDDEVPSGDSDDAVYDYIEKILSGVDEPCIEKFKVDPDDFILGADLCSEKFSSGKKTIFKAKEFCKRYLINPKWVRKKTEKEILDKESKILEKNLKEAAESLDKLYTSMDKLESKLQSNTSENVEENSEYLTNLNIEKETLKNKKHSQYNSNSSNIKKVDYSRDNSEFENLNVNKNLHDIFLKDKGSEKESYKRPYGIEDTSSLSEDNIADKSKFKESDLKKISKKNNAPNDMNCESIKSRISRIFDTVCTSIRNSEKKVPSFTEKLNDSKLKKRLNKGNSDYKYSVFQGNQFYSEIKRNNDITLSSNSKHEIEDTVLKLKETDLSSQREQELEQTGKSKRKSSSETDSTPNKIISLTGYKENSVDVIEDESELYKTMGLKKAPNLSDPLYFLLKVNDLLEGNGETSHLSLDFGYKNYKLSAKLADKIFSLMYINKDALKECHKGKKTLFCNLLWKVLNSFNGSEFPDNKIKYPSTKEGILVVRNKQVLEIVPFTFENVSVIRKAFSEVAQSVNYSVKDYSFYFYLYQLAKNKEILYTDFQSLLYELYKYSSSKEDQFVGYLKRVNKNNLLRIFNKFKFGNNSKRIEYSENKRSSVKYNSECIVWDPIFSLLKDEDIKKINTTVWEGIFSNVLTALIKNKYITSENLDKIFSNLKKDALRKSSEIDEYKFWNEIISYMASNDQIKEIGVKSWNNIFCSLFGGRNESNLLVKVNPAAWRTLIEKIPDNVLQELDYKAFEAIIMSAKFHDSGRNDTTNYLDGWKKIIKNMPLPDKDELIYENKILINCIKKICESEWFVFLADSSNIDATLKQKIERLIRLSEGPNAKKDAIKVLEKIDVNSEVQDLFKSLKSSGKIPDETKFDILDKDVQNLSVSNVEHKVSTDDCVKILKYISSRTVKVDPNKISKSWNNVLLSLNGEQLSSCVDCNVWKSLIVPMVNKNIISSDALNKVISNLSGDAVSKISGEKINDAEIYWCKILSMFKEKNLLYKINSNSWNNLFIKMKINCGVGGTVKKNFLGKENLKTLIKEMDEAVLKELSYESWANLLESGLTLNLACKDFVNFCNKLLKCIPEIENNKTMIACYKILRDHKIFKNFKSFFGEDQKLRELNQKVIRLEKMLSKNINAAGRGHFDINGVYLKKKTNTINMPKYKETNNHDKINVQKQTNSKNSTNITDKIITSSIEDNSNFVDNNKQGFVKKIKNIEEKGIYQQTTASHRNEIFPNINISNKSKQFLNKNLNSEKISNFEINSPVNPSEDKKYAANPNEKFADNKKFAFHKKIVSIKNKNNDINKKGTSYNNRPTYLINNIFNNNYFNNNYNFITNSDSNKSE